MRLPQGFGKKGYFSLATIQASTSEVKTKRHYARLRQTTRLFAESCDAQEVEDDPPPILSTALLGLISTYRPRICKCSRLFAKRAHSAIKRAKKRRKCNCHCRYFSFRRSGIHPPLFPFIYTILNHFANVIGKLFGETSGIALVLRP